jgi:hypothetical protein
MECGDKGENIFKISSEKGTPCFHSEESIIQARQSQAQLRKYPCFSGKYNKNGERKR